MWQKSPMILKEKKCPTFLYLIDFIHFHHPVPGHHFLNARPQIICSKIDDLPYTLR